MSCLQRFFFTACVSCAVATESLDAPAVDDECTSALQFSSLHTENNILDAVENTMEERNEEAFLNRGPMTSHWYYMAPQGEKCPGAALITTASACQVAYRAIKVDYTVYPSRRGLLQGDWTGVPWACSLQFKGQWVDVIGDESPHWNSNRLTDSSRLSSGDFRAICHGEPVGPPPKYVLMSESVTSCPPGKEVPMPECPMAYDAIKDDRTVHPARRGLVSGSWNGVPRGCSLQFKGPYVSQNKDESPHYNTYSSTDNSRVATGEFRIICKA